MMENDVLDAVVLTLMRGGTLLYPTDTIWGIGCDATDDAAVEKIYALKRRDHSKSMLVLCSDIAMVEHFVSPVDAQVRSLLLGEGRPTTVIMPLSRPSLAGNLVAADGTIGVRIPRMDFCRRMLERFGRPVVSTSANLSGRPSPASYADIDGELKDRVDLCVPPAYGQKTAGRSSRIVKLLSGGEVAVVRE